LIARLLPSLVPQLLSIALGWNFVISALGQGAHYLVAGWWASLLGLIMLAMGLMLPLAGLAVGLVASLFFRLPADRPVSDNAHGDLVFGGAFVYALAYLACGLLLWQWQPGRPGPNAAYGTGFVVTMVALALSFGLLASMVSAAVVARRHPIPR
jgi:hypothetical protein